LGFEYPANFNIFFKRQMQCTPKVFRANWLIVTSTTVCRPFDPIAIKLDFSATLRSARNYELEASSRLEHSGMERSIKTNWVNPPFIHPTPL
jgi:hypothetical protein